MSDLVLCFVSFFCSVYLCSININNKMYSYCAAAAKEITAMIRQICNAKLQDTATIRSNELLAWLGIEDLDLSLKEKMLRWFGYVERFSGAVNTAFDMHIDGKRGPGRPKLTLRQLTERHC